MALTFYRNARVFKEGFSLSDFPLKSQKPGDVSVCACANKAFNMQTHHFGKRRGKDFPFYSNKTLLHKII